MRNQHARISAHQLSLVTFYIQGNNSYIVKRSRKFQSLIKPLISVRILDHVAQQHLSIPSKPKHNNKRTKKMTDIKESLKQLKELFEEGLITEKVYEEEQKTLLCQLSGGNDFVTWVLGT